MPLNEHSSAKTSAASEGEILSKPDVTLGAVKELIEKNLKWSQIIYEQNRRLNSKLFWISLASWFKILLFIAVIGWSFLVLSPFVKNIVDRYYVVAGGSPGTLTSTSSLQSILPLLPLDAAQKEQLKAFLK